MKIEIKYIDLGKVISFLEENFKGLKSVMRSKIINYLGNHLEEVIAGEKTIRTDFKDDKEKLEQELKAYFEQTVIVEGSNFIKPLNIIKNKRINE